MNSILRWGILVVGAFILQWGAVYGQAKIKFERIRHDFGEIKEEEGVVATVFKFENTGTKPLLLKSVKATCGCTTPIWSRDSVSPGYYGFIKVEYNPLGRPGILRKEVHVETNGSPSSVKLAIVGRVTPRPKGPQDYYPFEEGSLRFRTNHLTFGSINDDETKTESTILYNQGRKVIKFSKSKSKVPSHLMPKMSKSVLVPGDTLTLWVTYNASARKDYGFTFDNFFLMTNDPNQQMKRINISADIKEHFDKDEKANAPRAKVAKTTIDLGDVIEGEMPTAVFLLQNEGKGPLKIRKFDAGCSCITVKECPEIAVGEEGELKATFNSRGRIGPFEKEIMLIVNSPSQPVWHLSLKGKVVRKKAEVLEEELNAPEGDDEAPKE